MIQTEKKSRGKNWKSYCSSICTSCNTIFFVRSANRYCYEDKFDLQQVPKKTIYKKDGKSHVLATGIIDHEKPTSNDGSLNESDLNGHTWENNFMETKPHNEDRYSHLISETCKEMKVSYKRFLKVLNKLSKECLNEN